jgi:CBS domain-containing protein
MELARNLKTDSVSRLQPTEARIVTSSQTVNDAVALMRLHRTGCVLVCEGQKIVGIFTERDLLRRILALNLSLSTPLASCMTPNPVTVQPKESVSVALQRMEEGGYRHLPVIDEAGRPVGVLSVKRIVHYLVEHFPATVYNLPPDPNVVPQSAEGA